MPNLFGDHEVSIDHIVAVTTAGNTVKLIGLGNFGPGTLNISSGDVTVNTIGTTIGWNNASTINQEVTIQAVGGTITIGSVSRSAEDSFPSGFVSRGIRR